MYHLVNLWVALHSQWPSTCNVTSFATTGITRKDRLYIREGIAAKWQDSEWVFLMPHCITYISNLYRKIWWSRSKDSDAGTMVAVK
jgi:hypothetical protein